MINIMEIYFLENRSEKFGTLVGKVYFQIGNTYISVEVAHIKIFKISNLILCNANSVNYNDDNDKN